MRTPWPARTLKVRPEYINKNIQCNHCRQLFRFQLPQEKPDDPTSELHEHEQVKAKNRALRKRVRSLEADIKRIVAALDARSAELMNKAGMSKSSKVFPSIRMF